MRKVFDMIIVIGFVLITVAFFPSTLTHAEELENDHLQLFEVTTDTVDMWSAPGANGEFKGQLQKGDRLRTFAEENGWVKTFYHGQPVWVLSNDLRLIEENNDIKQNPEAEKSEETEDNEAVLLDEYFWDEILQEHAIEEDMNLPVGYYQPKNVKISEDSITVLKNQLSGYVIMIDAGHGGHDSGAVNDGVLEKDITLETAKRIAEQLEEEGASVVFTRENDTFISLEERVYQSNSEETDVFISLHYDYFDNPEVNGFNTYYYHEYKSKQLAETIHNSLSDNLDMDDRGVRQEGYYVLANNHKPAVLLELGFMTNPNDLEKMQTEDYQNTVAKAITDGLVEYYESTVAME